MDQWQTTGEEKRVQITRGWRQVVGIRKKRDGGWTRGVSRWTLFSSFFFFFYFIWLVGWVTFWRLNNGHSHAYFSVSRAVFPFSFHSLFSLSATPACFPITIHHKIFNFNNNKKNKKCSKACIWHCLFQQIHVIFHLQHCFLPTSRHEHRLIIPPISISTLLPKWNLFSLVPLTTPNAVYLYLFL